MTPDADPLLDLASSISDGGAVDWDSTGSAGSEVDIVDQLRLVAKIADAHRTLQSKETPALEHFGAYTDLERIGRGGFGDVYKARDPRLDREVALKILRRAATAGGDHTEEILSEGRRLARVRHPNVISIFGAESDGDRVALCMEFIRGKTLDVIVKEQGRFGAAEAAAVGRTLCGALAAVHAAGLLHGDLKPRNVMREEGGRIVLMDFGLGDAMKSPAGAEPENAGGLRMVRLAGTPLTLAPEALAGGGISVHSDLYSLGVVLFHLLTGAWPVSGTTYEEITAAHEAGRRNHLRDLRPELPGAFVDVVERALEADPAKRFGSAGEMEAALQSAVLGMAGGPSPAPARRVLAWNHPAALIGAAAVIAAVFFIGRGTPKPPVGGHVDLPSSPAQMASPAGAAGDYSIEATFYRGDHPRVALAPGARVQVGDSLSMQVFSSRPVYLYVINEDEKGHAYLLFPLPGFEPANPVPSRAVIPGTHQGTPWFWQVTSAGGREHFLVVASPSRLTEFEADLLTMDRPDAKTAPEYVRLSDQALLRLRGVGGLVPGRTGGVPADAAPIYASAIALSDNPETVHGVWIRRIDFENP